MATMITTCSHFQASHNYKDGKQQKYAGYVSIHCALKVIFQDQKSNDRIVPCCFTIHHIFLEFICVSEFFSDKIIIFSKKIIKTDFLTFGLVQ